MLNKEDQQYSRSSIWCELLQKHRTKVEHKIPLTVEGKLNRMVGLTLETIGCHAAVGARCVVSSAEGDVEAEVVGFSGERLYLMPTGDITGLVPDARVVPGKGMYKAQVGDDLLGRVIDAAGKPLDGKGAIRCKHSLPLAGVPSNPLARWSINKPLDVGVTAINALLTVGRGQRLGLFAGSGVGKSVLLGMMTRYTDADVIIVGLIGERGREVKEFVDNILGEEGLERAVVVASPADSPPLMRMHGAWLATTIAEYFRDKGMNVLLLMDSLTRFAQAQREIALAIGEPPATKGYPPSVFAKLPQLVERAGNNGDNGGSITAFYTVLAEGDDSNDPIVDAARAVLDGHIMLSREIAEAGHFPAIDIEASVSRVMNDIVTDEHKQAAVRFKKLYSIYQRNRDLISIGAYQYGSDAEIDKAIDFNDLFIQFLQQDTNESVSYDDSINSLINLLDNTE
ncbi:MAG: flagellar protein export ATPase FliI [Gammaproteobacteria bacterium]|nr:flagellar protein export ATPase FliI [Gammaproteobacteria bacterium]